MLIRRFEGENRAEALRKVREAFGQDALVLGTKELRKGRAWLGAAARPVVEITAAVDRDHIERGASGGKVAEVDPSWKPLQLSRAVVEPLEDEVRGLRSALEDLNDRERKERSLSREINELRNLARKLARSVPTGDAAEDTYMSAGLSHDLASELAAVLAHRTKLGEARDVAVVECLAERIEARFEPPRDDDATHTMWVGGPGVGKTTTLAKLAARSGGSRLRVVTTDVHSWGGVEEIRGLVSGYGVEVDVAASPEELASLSRANKRERILVDTAGRSTRDASAIQELLAFRRALGEHARVELVMAATTKSRDLLAQIRHYAPLEPGSIVLSKADESVELGSVVDSLLDPDCPPLAYIGNGQRVPQDLEVPDPFEFAQRVMGAN